jgi:endonuclease-3
MKKTGLRLAEVLNQLEAYYEVQQAVGPIDLNEMILFVNCGYPATDASCTKGYEALKHEVGTKPNEILAAPKTKLARLMRLGGIVPELRAQRLKIIARMITDQFGSDLRGVLEKWLHGAEDSPGKGIRKVKKALKQFPVIGEPGADKILLFGGMAPVAAVPSAFVCVPQRILSGKEHKNYVTGYRAAQEAMEGGLPATFEARQRAYLLLKRHGQEICKRTKPKCDICPVRGLCEFYQEGYHGVGWMYNR